MPVRLTASPPDNPADIARTARTCIATARAKQPHGPYLLAGASEGGVIACEMARQWEQAGETVHRLLIDSRNPAPTPAPDAPFGGPVILIASRDALAEDAGLGWGGLLGERPRVVPIDRLSGRGERRQRLRRRCGRGWKRSKDATDPALAKIDFPSYKPYSADMHNRSSMDRHSHGLSQPSDGEERAMEDVVESIAVAIEQKNPHAAALGRLGGKKGGPARALSLSAERRSEIARLAARARWAKVEAEVATDD